MSVNPYPFLSFIPVEICGGFELRTRAISAIILLVVVSTLLWLGGILWLLGIILVALLSVHEFFAALRQIGRRPLLGSGVLLAIGLPCVAYFDKTLALMLPVIAVAITVSLALALVRRDLHGTLDDWALSLAGALYVSLLLAYFVALREHAQGLRWILLAFCCTWTCDSAAYLVGSAIGRHPFAPQISPKKTWEGTVGGVAAATAVGLLAIPLLDLPAVWGLLLGASVAVVAVAGDLAESLIKRQLGIKDFSALIPGHGGVLDRVDSLLFAVPLVYYIAIWLNGL